VGSSIVGSIVVGSSVVGSSVVGSWVVGIPQHDASANWNSPDELHAGYVTINEFPETEATVKKPWSTLFLTISTSAPVVKPSDELDISSKILLNSQTAAIAVVKDTVTQGKHGIVGSLVVGCLEVGSPVVGIWQW
jgi:hypothetical protein